LPPKAEFCGVVCPTGVPETRRRSPAVDFGSTLNAKQPEDWNMRGDGRVWLLWLNSKDRPKGTKGAKWGKMVRKGRKG